jgi:two-component system cell cycle response regulator
VAYVQELKARRAESLQLSGRVLLVEDSASVRAMVRGVLERTGLEVDLSADANRAWALFTEEQHDLVLTDVLLAEGTTGLELVRRIRHAQGRKSRTPVLAMSAFEDAVRKVELLEYGANDFIGKPVLPEELVARVRNLIANKQLLDKVEMQQEYLRALAATDHLTSLYNRRFLAEVVPMSLASARRHGYSLSLLMIDLDHFKAVNDRHGHSTGDCVLVETAKLLRANCRKEDLAARIGGEEFVLLLSHCGLEQATAKAERLRRQIEELEPAGIHLTASLGVATLVPESGESFEVLFAAADKAVYSAKAAGRNCVRITGASPEVPK